MQKPSRTQYNPTTLANLLGQITAGAGTSIYPALAEAFNQLDRVEAKRKHVILLTDGHSEPGNFDELIRHMAAQGITLSAVGLGEADTLLLKRMTQNGHGRFYSCKDAQTIPRIFVQETSLVDHSTMCEEPFEAKIAADVALVRGIDFTTAPPLLGFTTTKMKPDGQCILETDSGKPLLAWRSCGLGMCGVFTSDVRSIWSADWLSWSGFTPLWQSLARRMMRRPNEPGMNIAFRRNGRKLELALDAMDQQGRFLNGQSAAVTLTDAQGSTVKTNLEQTAPGYYEGSLPWPTQQGIFQIQATLQKHADEHELLTSYRGLVIGCRDELLTRGPNSSFLNSLAQQTGGMVNPTPSEILAPVAGRRVNRSISLWPWLWTAALLLYFPELILRRTASRSPKPRSPKQ